MQTRAFTGFQSRRAATVLPQSGPKLGISDFISSPLNIPIVFIVEGQEGCLDQTAWSLGSCLGPKWF